MIADECIWKIRTLQVDEWVAAINGEYSRGKQ